MMNGLVPILLLLGSLKTVLSEVGTCAYLRNEDLDIVPDNGLVTGNKINDNDSWYYKLDWTDNHVPTHVSYSYETVINGENTVVSKGLLDSCQVVEPSNMDYTVVAFVHRLLGFEGCFFRGSYTRTNSKLLDENSCTLLVLPDHAQSGRLSIDVYAECNDVIHLITGHVIVLEDPSARR